MRSICHVEGIQLYADAHALTNRRGFRQGNVGIVVARTVYFPGAGVAQLKRPWSSKAACVEPLGYGGDGADRAASDICAIGNAASQVVVSRVEGERIAGLQLGDGAELPTAEQQVRRPGCGAEPALALSERQLVDKACDKVLRDVGCLAGALAPVESVIKRPPDVHVVDFLRPGVVHAAGQRMCEVDLHLCLQAVINGRSARARVANVGRILLPAWREVLVRKARVEWGVARRRCVDVVPPEEVNTTRADIRDAEGHGIGDFLL